MSRAIGRTLKAGDAIVLTRMDHDANVAPWLMLADDLGLDVRWIDFSPESFEFDLSRLGDVITPGVKLVATGYASNVTGTIHDVAAIARAAKAVGALTYVDAVQFAPHGLIDVSALGCDVLVCSAYKFYGPHMGVLWGRRALLESLTAYKVRPADTAPPGKFETGTGSREGMAGVLGAIDYFASLGGESGTRRQRIAAGIAAADAHERALTWQLIDGLESMPGVTIMGLTNRQAAARRVPTVSFIAEGRGTRAIAEAMAAKGISLWSGHNYGIEPVTRLGLIDKGGVVRVGLAHYNTTEEIDRFLGELTATLKG
jgi:cysteine desulfurase family protein (TIGR01976 family)